MRRIIVVFGVEGGRGSEAGGHPSGNERGAIASFNAGWHGLLHQNARRSGNYPASGAHDTLRRLPMDRFVIPEQELIRRYLERVVLELDKRHAAELALEARPVALALLSMGASETKHADRWEGWPLVALLGRRAGALEITPTASLAFIHALVDTCIPKERLHGELREGLSAAYLEGYVAARDESASVQRVEEFAKHPPLVELVEGCWVLVLRGDLDAETLSAVVEVAGRRLLGSNASAICVDMRGLVGPRRDRALALFGLNDLAAMIGCTCVFTGVGEPWRRAAEEAGVVVDTLISERSGVAAWERALHACGLVVRKTSWLQRARRSPLRD